MFNRYVFEKKCKLDDEIETMKNFYIKDQNLRKSMPIKARPEKADYFKDMRGLRLSVAAVALGDALAALGVSKLSRSFNDRFEGPNMLHFINRKE